MTAPKVRADHESLTGIAQRFGQEASNTRQTLQRLKQQKDTLQGGDWIGKGATAFYQEMDSSILPTVQRLVKALEEGDRITKQISQIMKQAEDEASGFLRADGRGGSAGAGGTSGGAGTAGGAGGPGGGDTGAGASGGGGGAGTAGESGGESGGGGAGDYARRFFDSAKLKADGKGVEFRFKSEGKSPFSPSAKLKYGVEDSLYQGGTSDDGWKALGGGGGLVFGWGKDGPSAGVYGEAYGFKAKGDTVFAGDKDLGFTGAGEVKAASVEAMAGLKDGTLGASIGGTLASVKGELGANVSGYNVGVNAEVGLKAELGFKIGKKTELKLPFITIGFSFGKARD